MANDIILVASQGIPCLFYLQFYDPKCAIFITGDNEFSMLCFLKVDFIFCVYRGYTVSGTRALKHYKQTNELRYECQNRCLVDIVKMS